MPYDGGATNAEKNHEDSGIISTGRNRGNCACQMLTGDYGGCGMTSADKNRGDSGIIKLDDIAR